VPLVAGLYWRKASTQGAICAIALGIGAWLLLMATAAETFPPQLGGLIFAIVGMVAGSLAPQVLKNHHNKAAHIHV
jgi:Na+/proline symporter